MEALKKILESIEKLANELQLSVNRANALSATNANKEEELSRLITENTSEKKSLEEARKSVSEREKKVLQLANYEEAMRNLDQDQKEVRRLNQILSEKQAAHEKKVKEDTDELNRQKNKLQQQTEALDREKASYKETMAAKIIDDYIKEKLRG